MIECKSCGHDYDSHDVDAPDIRRSMPCSECPDGTCRYPGPAGEEPT